mmetsp:Transcript_50413/g.141057  ORF Transcript_50413/g.141057 Transcript_50413/m.141057 type:complete len:210 (-) Transcript_50413:384-1013(-)
MSLSNLSSNLLATTLKATMGSLSFLASTSASISTALWITATNGCSRTVLSLSADARNVLMMAVALCDKQHKHGTSNTSRNMSGIRSKKSSVFAARLLTCVSARLSVSLAPIKRSTAAGLFLMSVYPLKVDTSRTAMSSASRISAAILATSRGNLASLHKVCCRVSTSCTTSSSRDAMDPTTRYPSSELQWMMSSTSAMMPPIFKATALP